VADPSLVGRRGSGVADQSLSASASDEVVMRCATCGLPSTRPSGPPVLQERLLLAVDVIRRLADQQAMPDDWFEGPLALIEEASRA
jgi:hypothetical protein